MNRLSAVVLNFRTPEQTLAAVESLLDSRRPIDNLIIVNNDRRATDEERRRFQNIPVKWIDTGRNLGFSGGINVGIRAAMEGGADRVLLVNSDVTVPSDCVGRLEHCLDSAPQTGIVGPIVVARSNRDQIVSMGMSYSSRTGRMRHLGFHTPVASATNLEDRRVDGVMGCLMLVSRRVLDTVGLFDERYFFSFEDLDLCLRARRAGFVTLVAGKARVYHEGGGTIGQTSVRRLYFAARNHLLLAGRSGPSISPLPRALRMGSIVVLNLAHALRSSGGGPFARLSAVVRGTMDYFYGELGEGRARQIPARTAVQSTATIKTASAPDSL